MLCKVAPEDCVENDHLELRDYPSGGDLKRFWHMVWLGVARLRDEWRQFCSRPAT